MNDTLMDQPIPNLHPLRKVRKAVQRGAEQIAERAGERL